MPDKEDDQHAADLLGICNPDAAQDVSKDKKIIICGETSGERTTEESCGFMEPSGRCFIKEKAADKARRGIK